jgi:hypothetical protein
MVLFAFFAVRLVVCLLGGLFYFVSFLLALAFGKARGPF